MAFRLPRIALVTAWAVLSGLACGQDPDLSWESSPLGGCWILEENLSEADLRAGEQWLCFFEGQIVSLEHLYGDYIDESAIGMLTWARFQINRVEGQDSLLTLEYTHGPEEPDIDFAVRNGSSLVLSEQDEDPGGARPWGRFRRLARNEEEEILATVQGLPDDRSICDLLASCDRALPEALRFDPELLAIVLSREVGFICEQDLFFLYGRALRSDPAHVPPACVPQDLARFYSIPFDWLATAETRF
jgi:hypothetical protein